MPEKDSSKHLPHSLGKKKAVSPKVKTTDSAIELSPPTPSSLFVVGIGASAGGLEAVTHLLKKLDHSVPCAYVLLQHLSPTYRSMMVEILARETSLAVTEAKSGEVLQQGVVSVVPPNHNAIIKDGRLLLVTAGPEVVPKPSINQFLTSLASEAGESAVGVVLSGTGTDGTAGLRAIQAAGGFTFVQKPETATYDGMPRAAIDAGVAGWILSPEEIAVELGRLAEIQKNPLGENLNGSTLLGKVLSRLKEHTHIDFSGYKMGSLFRRIERRIVATGTGTIADYLTYLNESPSEIDALSRDILISVTSFFRDTSAFSVLSRIVREIVNRKAKGGDIRVWVAGCATGEEAYSIAILFADILGSSLSDYKLQIFATDIDDQALTIARRGLYPIAAMRDVSPDHIRDYFSPFGQNYEVAKKIRDMIVFARHNLVSDPPFMRLDLVSCRNVLIYFDAPLQNHVLASFHFGLNSDAFLFLGQSESIAHGENLFLTVDRKNRIFRKGLGGSEHIPVLTSEYKSDKGLTTSVVARREKILLENMLEGLSRHLSALIVLVGGNQEILHSVGDPSPYLIFPQGKPKLLIGEVVIEPLRGELLALLHRTFRRGENARGRLRRVADRRIRMHVLPLANKADAEALVLFVPEPEATAGEDDSTTLTSLGDQEKHVLEDELLTTREHLQTLVEEMATANEEMQALNEEAQASNEELQASNEELQAANEELQASNEELVSLNEELSVKTNQLESLNLELENLFNALDFPLMLFDSQFILRRLNSPASRDFGLRPSAIGQPIHRLRFPGWISPLEKMMGTTLASGERDLLMVKGKDREFQIIVSPGGDSGGQITSLLVSVVDLTEVIHVQQELDKTKGVVNVLMEKTTIMFVMKDVRGEYIYANSRFCDFFGVDKEAVKGKNDFSILPKSLTTDLWAADLEALREGISITRSHTVTISGRDVYLEAIHSPIFDGEGSLSAISTEMLDVTFRHHAEEQLRLAAKVFDRAGEGIIVTDSEGRISTVNPVFTRITGYSLEESIGKTPGELLKSGRQSPDFYREMWRGLRTTGGWRGEIWNKRKSGEIYPEWLTINAVEDEEGRLSQYIGIFSDITDIKNAQVRADFLATHDTLTGLPNRALLQDRLRYALASSDRERTSVAIAFIDLDNFKIVNDSFGHEVGDALLRTVSERLSKVVRTTDTLARLGGDEFIVIMQESDPVEIERVAVRVLDELSRSFDLSGQRVFVSASVGIAFYPQDAEDSSSLIQAADTAMYRAKEEGRNRIEFFRPEMRVKIMERATIETALRNAINEKNLFLMFQPQVEAATGKVVGAECLARWTDPHLGEVSPARFIPIAEQTGLIVSMTRLLLRGLLDQMRSWVDSGIVLPPIGFNLSARDFYVEDTASFIIRELRERSLSPALLKVEVTEQTLMEDVGVTGRNIQIFKEAGIDLMIDDFGTGYSSLAYLKRLPVSIIKIDRTFVDGLPFDEGDEAITSAIISIAKAMGIDLIAEGVETSEQMTWLSEHGCLKAQGFFFHRPLREEEFRRLILSA